VQALGLLGHTGQDGSFAIRSSLPVTATLTVSKSSYSDLSIPANALSLGETHELVLLDPSKVHFEAPDKHLVGGGLLVVTAESDLVYSQPMGRQAFYSPGRKNIEVGRSQPLYHGAQGWIDLSMDARMVLCCRDAATNELLAVGFEGQGPDSSKYWRWQPPHETVLLLTATPGGFQTESLVCRIAFPVGCTTTHLWDYWSSMVGNDDGALRWSLGGILSQQEYAVEHRLGTVPLVRSSVALGSGVHRVQTGPMPNAGSVYIRAVDENSGAPIESIGITLRAQLADDDQFARERSGVSLLSRGCTDSGGQFSAPIPSGLPSLFISTSSAGRFRDLENVEHPVDPSSSGEVQIMLRLGTGSEVQVHVQNSIGLPSAVPYRVSLSRQSAKNATSARAISTTLSLIETDGVLPRAGWEMIVKRTDALGRATFPGTGEGTYVVEALPLFDDGATAIDLHSQLTGGWALSRKFSVGRKSKNVVLKRPSPAKITGSVAYSSEYLVKAPPVIYASPASSNTDFIVLDSRLPPLIVPVLADGQFVVDLPHNGLWAFVLRGLPPIDSVHIVDTRMERFVTLDRSHTLDLRARNSSPLNTNSALQLTLRLHPKGREGRHILAPRYNFAKEFQWNRGQNVSVHGLPRGSEYSLSSGVDFHTGVERASMLWKVVDATDEIGTIEAWTF
jgi:hypothetical protein